MMLENQRLKEENARLKEEVTKVRKDREEGFQIAAQGHRQLIDALISGDLKLNV
jgi:FtsZ-binding cell division protein ZapB